MTAIYEAVSELVERGARVLSPADPRIVDQIGEFVFVASDKVRSIKMVQDRHLECIRESDFLWLVAPDGYVGQSASMELGYAVAHGVPVFSINQPVDGTLEKYVQRVSSMNEAFTLVAPSSQEGRDTFLIDPIAVIDRTQIDLNSLRERLDVPTGHVSDKDGETVLTKRGELSRLLEPSRPASKRTAAV